MVRQAIFLCALAGLFVVVGGCDPEPAAITVDKAELVARDGVEPKAIEILYRASKYLQQTKTFKFQADVTRDVILYDGVRVQFSGISKVIVQRPNKLQASFDGDERSRRSYFDGETLTICSLTRNTYAQAKISGTIDEAIDFVFETFGFSIPLADLVYADPYAVLIENVDKGYFVGQHKIDGVLCDHLVFQQEQIDWQKRAVLQDSMTCVSMGNPHVVFFCEDVGEVPLEEIGPIVENASIFPDRVNLHVVQVRSPGEVVMRTWERGSGITLACGTGAAAVCVAG
ncbi:hypothetical protein LCGC14_2614720, partial [marine sediment metagenome]